MKTSRRLPLLMICTILCMLFWAMRIGSLAVSLKWVTKGHIQVNFTLDDGALDRPVDLSSYSSVQGDASPMIRLPGQAHITVNGNDGLDRSTVACVKAAGLTYMMPDLLSAVLLFAACANILRYRYMTQRTTYLLWATVAILLLSAAVLPLFIMYVIPAIMHANANDSLAMAYDRMVSWKLCGKGLAVMMYAVIAAMGEKAEPDKAAD